MKERSYAVIGLGQFGMTVALTLAEANGDVLAIDENDDNVQDIAEKVTYAVKADVREPGILQSLGVQNVDVAVIAVAENMEASITATMQVKELGVPFVMAKAMTSLHGRILEKIGADKVIYPEQSMGIRVAKNLLSSGFVDMFELSSQKQSVKQWYDGFIFGNQKDIYNPWSITNFLAKRKLQTYWASTSSNRLVGTLIRTASSFVKEQMEELLHGNEIVVTFDEQIVFNQLDQNENAIWSLLMAAGYLKPEQVEYRGELMKPWYHLKITNLETRSMFADMFAGWFQSSISSYNNFISALIQGNLKQMNIYMNEVALETFSSFDTGKRISPRTQPERFYHGFVLGLLVELREEYQLKSNRESGFGRYDVMLIPHDKEKNAIILEFKVFDKDEESDLNDTAQAALKQIDDRQYDTELLSLGFPKDRIRHYGFAFEGKKVLIR